MATPYHYTTFAGAMGIIRSNTIKLSEPRPGSDNVRAVWFSTNPDFEAGMGTYAMHPETGEVIRWTRADMESKCGLVRFSTGLEVVTPFAEIMATGRCIRTAQLSMLEGFNVADWYVFLQPFPLRYCTGADVYLDGRWQKMTAQTIKALSDSLPNGFGATVDQIFQPAPEPVAAPSANRKTRRGEAKAKRERIKRTA